MSGWEFRREVTIPEVQGQEFFKPDDIASAVFYTFGKSKPDASDIRVVTYSGSQMPVKILNVGPGDRVELLFGLTKNIRNYIVYWGNHSADGNAPELDVKKGVVQEIKLNYKEPPANAFEAARIFESAGKTLGVSLRDRIFQGYNPIGPQNNIASRYTGFLKCPQDGLYVFRMACNDGGFLFIDDKPVISNGGSHRPGAQYPGKGEVQLTAGTHKLTVVHINRRWYPVVALAWKTPSQPRTLVIPPAAFEKIYESQVSPARQYGKPLTVDFNISNEGESYCDEMYFQRYVFEAQTSGDRQGATQWIWKFGDGTTATGEKVSRVFLRDGDFSVTLTAKSAGGEVACTNRIFVTRDWARAVWGKGENAAEHAEIVSKYDFANMESESLIGAFVLLRAAKNTNAMVNAARTLLSRDRLSSHAVNKVLMPVIDAMQADGQLEGAVNLLCSSEKKTKWADVSAGLLLRAGNLLLELDKPDDALVLFERITGHYAAQADSQVIRLGRIGVGDAYRAKGDYQKAMESYRRAGVASVDEKNLDFERGNFTRHVEQYLSERQYDWAMEFLDKWETAIPADRLEGYSSLLRIKVLTEMGENKKAVKLADVMLKVNPLGNYGDRILWQKVEILRARGESGKADEAMEQLRRMYPESSLNSKG